MIIFLYFFITFSWQKTPSEAYELSYMVAAMEEQDSEVKSTQQHTRKHSQLHERMIYST